MFASALLTLSVATSLSASPALRPSPWSALAEEDLRVIHQTMLRHHPGPVDPLNPEFRNWLEGGYQKALRRARAARTFGGYWYALRYYIAGFRDGHVNLFPALSVDSVSWPGFVISLRGGRYVVASVDPAGDDGLPPVGSELLSCDGETPEALLRRTVWPYLGNEALEASRTKTTPWLLQDDGNPDAPRPKRCEFRVGQGIRTVELSSRSTPGVEVAKLREMAAFGAPPAFGVRRFGKNGLWVSIPSFHAPKGPEVLAGLKDLIARAPQWRDADVIVFDVRGNGGGSSRWGDDILRGLYGEDFYRAREAANAPKDEYVEWRVSKENVAYLRSLVGRFQKERPDAPDLPAHFRALADGMASAAKAGTALYREQHDGAHAPPAPGTAPANPVRARVFLLTDGRCASACLDFADAALSFPGVSHVGLPTSADSVYMDVRVVPLPSGAASVVVPLKVYRNRPRGHNVPYVPAQRFEGDISDTAALERWVEGLSRTAAR